MHTFLLRACALAGAAVTLACSSSKVDAGAEGVQGASPGVAPTFFTTFDAHRGELPEDLLPLADGGFIVSFVPTGRLARVSATGSVTPFGSLAGQVTGTLTLGLATDDAGDVFVAVAAGAPSSQPAPGIYRIPAGGGVATVFATSASPPMLVPNGVDRIGADLFVADSTGVVFKVSASGATEAWSQDALLHGDKAACGGLGLPFDVGANGITHDANDVYVSVSDTGALVRIPIRYDGTAGPAQILARDCALHGIDGLALAPDGTLVAALNSQNKVVRVARDGRVSPLLSGEPLQSPANVKILQSGARLFITNQASAAAATDGGHPSPGIVTLALPK